MALSIRGGIYNIHSNSCRWVFETHRSNHRVVAVMGVENEGHGLIGVESVMASLLHVGQVGPEHLMNKTKPHRIDQGHLVLEIDHKTVSILEAEPS
eukprot:2507018-Prymnesium_polylepis.1